MIMSSILAVIFSKEYDSSLFWFNPLRYFHELYVIFSWQVAFYKNILLYMILLSYDILLNEFNGQLLYKYK